MTIDKLRQSLMAQSMNVRLTRAEREERASLRNAAEIARRTEMFYTIRAFNREVRVRLCKYPRKKKAALQVTLSQRAPIVDTAHDCMRNQLALCSARNQKLNALGSVSC